MPDECVNRNVLDLRVAITKRSEAINAIDEKVAEVASTMSLNSWSV